MPVINKKNVDQLKKIKRYELKPYDWNDLKKQHGRFWRVDPNEPVHKPTHKDIPLCP